MENNHIEKPPVGDPGILANAAHGTLLFGEGLLNGALLKPINAVGQIFNGTTGTHLPKLEFSNQDKVEKSTTGFVGEAIGSLATFVALEHSIGRTAGLKARGTMSMAAAGAIQAGVFTSSDGEKSGVALFRDRLENAAVGVVSTTIMGKGSELLGTRNIFPSMTQRVIYGAMSGGIAGEVNYIATASIKGQQFTEQGFSNAMTHGAIFGAGFGAAGSMFESAALRANRPPKLDPNQAVFDVRVKGNISPAMRENMIAGITALPPKVQKLLSESGTNLIAGEKMSQIDPTARVFGGNINATQGGYMRAKGVLLAERSIRTPGVEKAHPENANYILRHELGHNVEDLLGLPSASRAYRRDHQADVAEMPQHIREMLNHFVQPGRPKVGASESWAEIFAVLNGGGRNQQYTQAVLDYFPRTTKRVSDSLSAIPEAKTNVPPQINFHQS